MKIYYLRHFANVQLFFITTVSLALRLYGLRNYPHWYIDEGINVHLGMNLWRGHLGYYTFGPNFFPPLYNFLLGTVAILIGPDYLYTRLVGVFFGTASCILVYELVRRLYDERYALISALILSVTSSHINRMALQHNGAAFFFLCTVFASIKLEEGVKKEKWSFAAGLFTGLALLSHYLGVIPAIFLGLKLCQKRDLKILAYTIVGVLPAALCYLIMAFQFGLEYFVRDMILLQTAFRSPNPLGLLYMFIGPPVNWDPIIVVGWDLRRWYTLVYAFTVFGFVANLAVLAWHEKRDTTLILMTLSSLIGLTFGRNISWFFFPFLLPSYSIAISRFILHALSKRENIFFWLIPFLLVASIQLSSTFEQLNLGDAMWLLFYFFFAIFLCAAFMIIIPTVSFNGRIPFKKVISTQQVRKIFVIFFIVMLLFLLPLYDLNLLVSDHNRAQGALVEYLNKNTTREDWVAINPSLIPLLKANAISHEHVAFFIGKEPQTLYPDSEFMLSRFKMDLNIWRFKYFVTDPRLSLGARPNDLKVLEILSSSFLYIGSIGVYSIFLNPKYTLETSLGDIMKFNLTEYVKNIRYAYGLNTDKNELRLSNGALIFSTRINAYRGWSFWEFELPQELNVSQTGFYLIKYKVSDENIRVVSKFIDINDREVGGWFMDDNPPIVDYRIGSFKVLGNYTLRSVVLGFDWNLLRPTGNTIEAQIEFVAFMKYMEPLVLEVEDTYFG